MHRLVKVATALFVSTVVLAGCAATEEEPSAPQGPNGYTNAADLGDGYILWWDRSPESGMSDVIATDPETHIVGSCLSDDPIYCVDGPTDSQVVLVIGPPEAERAVIQWFGEDIELARGDTSEEDAPPVFGAIMPPPADPEAGYHLNVFDGAGEVVFTS
ncbi:hypothetical protein [Agrococcus sp. KRD186]|uniref:hypothetical protein n=1 Tax=Agrococcus sp. KRD186 TaxID=2729730 RepID=UPI0019CFC4C4|nr:hypothetical protein [Agrococcus sp. KRD186]